MGNLVVQTRGGQLVYGSTYMVLLHSFGNFVRSAQSFLSSPYFDSEQERCTKIQSCKNDFVNLNRAAYNCADLSVEKGITRHYVGYLSSLADMLDWSNKEDLEILIEELVEGLDLPYKK